MAEDEMVGWHHRLNGHEFEQTLGNSEEQESLACGHPCVHKESDRTEQLNNNYVQISMMSIKEHLVTYHLPEYIDFQLVTLKRS